MQGDRFGYRIALLAWFDVVEKGISCCLPAVKATAERTNSCDAEFVELQGDLAACLLRRASAIEHDIAIAGNVAASGGEFRGLNAERSGKRSRIGQVIERMPQIDDEWREAPVCLGFLIQGHKFGGFKTERANSSHKASLLDDSIGKEANDHEHEGDSGESAEHGEEALAALSNIAKETASEKEAQRPDC